MIDVQILQLYLILAVNFDDASYNIPDTSHTH